MIRNNKLFPGMLVAVMVLLTYWLDQITQLPYFARKLNPTKPEFVAEDVIMVRFTVAGQRQEQLSAARAWQFPNQRTCYFDDVFLMGFKAGKLDYSVKAGTGNYNYQARIGFFDRQVVMQQLTTTAPPPMKILTSAMHLNIESAIAESDAPVTFYSDTTVAHAVGFRYNYRSKQLYLLRNARMIYEK